MARNIEEITQEMIDQKEAAPELDSLTSTSKVSIWHLIFSICATAIKFVEDLYDSHRAYVNTAANRAIAGTLQWYADQSLYYQHGDELVYDPATGNVIYQIIDEDKQVVKLSASDDDGTGAVYIKTAKLDGSGVPVALSAPELAGLQGYWLKKKFAGTNLNVSSGDPDEAFFYYRIVYDATILDEYGALLTDSSVFPVEDAINQYLIDFGLNNFNGVFQLMNLTDAIQNVNGVVNATVTQAEAGANGQAKLDIMADADHLYYTVAGYLEIDAAYPLNTTLTYIAVA